MPQSLKKQAFVGVAWSAVESFSVKGITFLIQIVLARLLVPADYGIIGMLAIFMQVGQVFVDSGFANALIQKKECTEDDYSTVFYYNLAIAVSLYLIFFFIAPLVATFYEMELLTSVMRVLSLVLIINALSIVHRTKLIKSINFKSQSIISFTSALLSGAIGIAMAYYGLGVWALVWQQILNSVFLFLLFFYFTRWKPSLVFSMEAFKPLFKYGSRLLGASLLNQIYRNLYTIVIGKKFSAENLGYYTRAEQFAIFPSHTLSAIVVKVAFPTLSKIQDDDQKLRVAYRKIIRLTSYIIFPLMVLVIALAEPFILFTLSAKWSAAIILLQILCLDWMLDHLSGINLNLLYVKGRSDLALRLEVIKKTTAVAILFASIPFGLIGMCWGRLVYSIFATIANSYYTERLISLSFFQQMRDILPYLLLSFIMGGVVYFVANIFDNSLVQLIVGSLTGIVVYSLLSWLFLNDIVNELLQMIKNRK